jgi:hypothetical protein
MNFPLLRQIFNELAASQMHWLLWHSMKWAVIGALLGLLGSLVIMQLFRRIGWYQSGWRRAGWIRWPLWVVSVTVCVLLAAAAGLCRGLARGTEHVLLNSQLATKVFPVVGDALADGLAGFQLYAASTNSGAATRTNVMAGVESFRSGGWELNVPLLQSRLDQMEAGAISNVVANLESNLVARTPQLQSGLPNVLLHQSLNFASKLIIERKIHSELKSRKLDQRYAALRAGLLSEAQKSGAPDTIARAELSAFTVRELVVPGLMVPIRMLLAEQAVLLLLLAALAALLPAPAFRFTLGRVKAKPPQTSATATAQPGG